MKRRATEKRNPYPSILKIMPVPMSFRFRPFITQDAAKDLLRACERALQWFYVAEGLNPRRNPLNKELCEQMNRAIRKAREYDL